MTRGSHACIIYAILFMVAVTRARSSLSSLQISWAQAKNMPLIPGVRPMRKKEAHFQVSGMDQAAMLALTTTLTRPEKTMGGQRSPPSTVSGARARAAGAAGGG